MEKVYVVIALAKDNPNENWRFLENDIPGSLSVYQTFLDAKEGVSTFANSLKFWGWREHVFTQVENVREWREFIAGKKHISLLIIEKELFM